MSTMICGKLQGFSFFGRVRVCVIGTKLSATRFRSCFGLVGYRVAGAPYLPAKVGFVVGSAHEVDRSLGALSLSIIHSTGDALVVGLSNS